MDLFRNLQLAISDYTSEAFDGFDKEDVEGLIKTAMMKQSQKWKVRFHHWKHYLRTFQNRKLILISLNFSAEITAMTMKNSS